MAFMAFRPTLWPTLFTVPALILLLGLGTWQLERLEWKEGLIATRTARSTGPEIALPADAAPAASYEWSRTRATGRLLNDKELYLAARSMNGNVGYRVVTPLLEADGSAVLIDRGWIPNERKDPGTRAAGELAGEVAIGGLLRGSQRQSWLVPDNEPQHNVWFYVDTAAMGAAAGLAHTHPYFIEADATPNPGGYPIGGQSNLELPNNHLQYAITWYCFALTLAVIYVLYHRKLEAERKAAAKAAEAKG